MAVLSNTSVLAGASAAGGGSYDIEKSLRFAGSDDNAHLTRTFAAGGSASTWTLSFWIKAWNETQACYIFTGGTGTTSYITMDVGQLRFYSNNHDLKTNAKYRDPAAWMHVVCLADTTNGTTADRERMYVNGERITSFATESNVSGSGWALGDFNSASDHYFNRLTTGNQQDFILADVHFVDAAAKEPTDFGEFHSDTGQWIPKKYSGSHGTTGFHLKFNDLYDSSGTIKVPDNSSNSNEWSCSNINATAPVLGVPSGFSYWTAGYTSGWSVASSKTSGDDSDYIAQALPSSGKVYWETVIQNPSTYACIGVTDEGGDAAGPDGYEDNMSGFYFNNTTTYKPLTLAKKDGGTSTADQLTHGPAIADSWSHGDVLQWAFDADNSKMWVGRNGTWLTGDPGAGTNAGFQSMPSQPYFKLAYVTAADSTGNRTFEIKSATSAAPGSHMEIDTSDDTPGSPWDNERNGGGNYAVLNPLSTHDTSTSAAHKSEVRKGGTQAYSLLASHYFSSTWEFKSGKWYFEFSVEAKPTPESGQYITVGWMPTSDTHNVWGASVAGYYILYSANSQMQRYAAAANDLGTMADGSGFMPGKTYGVAIDMGSRKVWYTDPNGTWMDEDWDYATNGDPVAGTNPVFTLPGTDPYYLHIDADNAAINFNFGARPYQHTQPTGYKACNVYNLPEPAVLNPSKHFGISTWTGDNAASRAIDGLNFQPDMVWGKNRDGNSHQLFDAIRGAGSAKELTPNATFDEGRLADPNTPVYGWLSAFNSDGFTVTEGSSASDGNFYWNESGSGHVAWSWYAGGTSVTNDASETSIGSIDSTYRANTDAGFSIVTYTGDGVAGSTIAHGLNAKPDFIITKSRNYEYNWTVYHKDNGNTNVQYLNLDDDPEAQTYFWNNTDPTSTVFTVGTDGGTGGNGSNIVAYCWSEVEGYSKFGTYTGEASFDSGVDGPFVYCGFLPRWLMIKQAHSGYAGSWVIYDTGRTPTNSGENWIYGNSGNAEAAAATYAVTVHSNGFRIRSTSAENNGDGRKYIFAAFAESSFKYANAK